MTIQNLRYFKAVADQKNFTRAAQELFVSQPSLSHAIRELEKEFGVQLTIRKSRGLELTKQGEQFLEFVTNYLQYTDYVERSLHSLAPEHRKLRIGTPPMLSVTFYGDWVREIQSKIGEIEFQLVVGGSNYLRSSLRNRELDCAIIPWDDHPSDRYISIPLRKERYVCCMARNHPLASREILSVKDLVYEPIAILDKSFQNNDFTRRMFAMYNAKPNVVLETNQYFSVREMVAAGLAISFTFQSYVDVDRERLVGIPLEEVTRDQTICFVTQKSRFQLEPIQAILNHYQTQES